MRQKRFLIKRAAAGLALAVCLSGGFGAALPVQAEEQSGYLDESGMWIVQEDYSASGGVTAMETSDVQAEGAVGETPDEEDTGLTGTYTVASGWSEDAETEAQTGDSGIRIFRQDSRAGETETSTITCSYMDTGYSVLEYEQLRDMLTNNLLYNNVNAQISTSAVYTLAKDYLYIVLVDDSGQDYRDIYHYVVGDYRCFCVQVHEYRAEAQQMEAADQETPQEAGRSMAEGFTWNAG